MENSQLYEGEMCYTYKKMETAHEAFNTTHRIHRNNRIDRITSNISFFHFNVCPIVFMQTLKYIEKKVKCNCGNVAK